MTRATTGTYRGASTAERREDRRRRLLDAALDIVGTNGLSALTVRGVCEQAKVGPRFFYEAFPDLDALAIALQLEVQNSALDSARTAIAVTAGTPAQRIRAGVAALITDLTDDPRRAHIVFAQAFGSEALMRSRFASMRTVAATIIEQTRVVLDLPEGQDAAVAATSQLITGGAAELVLVWLDGGLDVDREGLIDLLADFTIAMIERLPAVAVRLG
ncbi:TetR/AcrR family transcriptional regulator [Nocardia farcinica]|uniref:HTH-type transcriptional repressor KstR n=2 Tax=Nocardia farcinica TaxID=37329 RepID=A0A0H5NTD1_NOCFR|nr:MULTISPECIES: TetR/AcrR family transcriptional regulator [Nocardia]AXK86132.1 TetR/AcrR family transcriptional regulator [Nocardia farcinica]MBA4855089.1 TetR/AcrR family transcriptional regulator [Nocardia farcinica]MBC9815913.1 TetR/AcrR family transcriptional regulator [Nocardia farcinica]MBF6142065.1 TetR/AcrR family transcriptional regulator [Nocardia farcinica]MBF6186069.1 TetR/AcrR family transcriptional regulator [Nocardia farcinica]